MRERLLKYLILLAHAPDAWTSASAEQRQLWHGEHLQFHREVAGNLLAGEALESADTATTLRRGDGHPVFTDGPFAETAEVIGGFYLVEATDLDQVSSWGALLPECYAVEIRPCVTVAGFGD